MMLLVSGRSGLSFFDFVTVATVIVFCRSVLDINWIELHNCSTINIHLICKAVFNWGCHLSLFLLNYIST